MVKIYRSAVIQRPIDKVWPLIRAFDGIHEIAVSLAERTEIDGGAPADQLGCVRTITLKDGNTIRERLVTLSDHEHTLTYIILESPLGVDNYVATMRAFPVTDSGTTFVDWSAEFTCQPGRETELAAMIGDGVFGAGLAQMQKMG